MPTPFKMQNDYIRHGNTYGEGYDFRSDNPSICTNASSNSWVSCS